MTTRKLALVTAVVILLATSPALASSSVRWPQGRPLRVLFVGDSITFGIRATTKAQAFPALVTAAMQNHGDVSATVLGKGGAGAHYWQSQKLPRARDVVVIQIGTNDMGALGHAHRAPTYWFTKGYTELRAKIKATSPKAQVFCLGVWRPDAAAPARRFDTVIRKLCKGTFVSLEQLALVSENVSAVDGLHPTDAGHAAIADAVIAKMKL